MRWQTKVQPPNREFYLNRCRSLRRSLNSVEIMPPMIIVANCWFVLKRALGSDWRVLRWILLNMGHDKWEHWKEHAWFTWHYYIRCRTQEEITELIDQWLEKTTGYDDREWPDVVTVEGETQA